MSSVVELAALPDDCLLAIFESFPYETSRALGLVNKRFNEIYRTLKTRITFSATSAEELKAFALSQPLQLFPNALECSIFLCYPGKPALRRLADIKAPYLEDLTLIFEVTPPSGHSFVNLQGFQALARLCLGVGSSYPPVMHSNWLNLDGGLSVLASLPNLRNLELRNLGSDKGLENLTQVTFLIISFPSHGNFNHNQIHDYLYGPQDGAVVLGHAIKHMQNLQKLILDFCCHDGMSPSGLLNRFDWGGKDEAGQATTTPIWPSLVKIEIQSAGRSKKKTIHQYIKDRPFLLSRLKISNNGLDMWRASHVYDAFRCMPALQAYRLQIEEGDWDLIDLYQPVWHFPSWEFPVWDTSDAAYSERPLVSGKICNKWDDCYRMEVSRPSGLPALTAIVQE